MLDLIEHRRTRVAWIVTAHGLLVAVGLAVVWWATRSVGTQRAEASGWPTTNNWPQPSAEASEPAPPNDPVRPADVAAPRVAEIEESVTQATPEPDVSNGRVKPEPPAVRTPDAGLEVVPRLVELPVGRGLIESMDETMPATAPRRRVVPMDRPRATGLPPGGVRPVFDSTDAIVDWLMPIDTRVRAEGETVALTTGQIQIETTPVVTRDPEPRPAPDASSETQNSEASRAATPQSTEVAPEPRDGGVAEAQQTAATKTVVSAPPSRDLNAGSFFGLPAGDRTVYLLDASGSLLDTLPFAIEELYRSVRTLDDRQQYAVVFFNGDGVIEAAPGQMKPATRENLTQTLTWLEPRLANVRAKGRPDAADALAHALTLRPDTIILLSDGVTGLRDPAADRRRLVTLLERLGRGVAVHTIQFIDPDPLAARGRLGTLELLASLSAGQHRFVSLAEVAPQPRR
ncbi:MAG: hypothetical protein AAGH92_10400 [Planctomycetota bacterium]